MIHKTGESGMQINKLTPCSARYKPTPQTSVLWTHVSTRLNPPSCHRSPAFAFHRLNAYRIRDRRTSPQAPFSDRTRASGLSVRFRCCPQTSRLPARPRPTPHPLTAPAFKSVVTDRLLSAITLSFVDHAVASPMAGRSRRLIISHASHRGHDEPVPLRVPLLPFALPSFACAAASVAPLVCHA